jgi:RNA polymerase sigma-70 factor, ECF subfamily
MGRGSGDDGRVPPERASLRELIDAGFSSLHGDLVRYLGAIAGADAAEDIASQVWLEVVGRESAFRGDETALRRLAFATARRRALDHRRRWWRRAVTLHPPGDRALERAAPDEPYDVGRDRALDHRRRWWRRAVTLHPPGDRALERAAPDEPYDVGRDRALDRIARLPRSQAEVVLLRVMAGFSAEEVAQMTGRTPGAVRVLQHRALRRLADDMRRDPEPDDRM